MRTLAGLVAAIALLSAAAQPIGGQQALAGLTSSSSEMRLAEMGVAKSEASDSQQQEQPVATISGSTSFPVEQQQQQTLDRRQQKQLEWQLRRMLQRVQEESRPPSARTPAGGGFSWGSFLASLQQPTAASGAEIGRREANSNYQQQLGVLVGAERERRKSSLSSGQLGSGGIRLLATGQQLASLDQSLSSLFDGSSDSSSRLGRIYQPRTISTARGFGKRAQLSWRPRDDNNKW